MVLVHYSLNFLLKPYRKTHLNIAMQIDAIKNSFEMKNVIGLKRYNTKD